MKKLLLIAFIVLTGCDQKSITCQAIVIDCKIGSVCPPEVYQDIETGNFVSKEKCDTILKAN